MENSPNIIGPRGLINKYEFVRVIIQCLYSLGYQKSACCLESESGVSYNSKEFKELELQILNGDWDGCVDTLNAISELKDDEIRASALFLIFKQWFSEYLKRGDDSLALNVLRKQVSSLQMSKEKVRGLASNMVGLKEMELEKIDDGVSELRTSLLAELERLLPPPVVVPGRRLEHLVETAVMSQFDSCLYHNSPVAVSVYEDHCCGREQIPTETVQILTEHENEVWFVQFSNSGEYLASSSSDRTAIIWKVLEDSKLTLKHTLKGHQKPVSFAAWSPDDTKLLTCGNAEVLKLWDVETGICKHTFEDHSCVVSSCAWFPDSKRLVCGKPEKGIFIWDCDGNEIKAWRGMRIRKILDLAVTPDGEYLISVLSEKEIWIVNLGTYAERVIYEEHPISSLSVSADSKNFIVNLNGQEIHMWDVAAKWEKPFKYMGHKQNKYVIRSCFGGFDCTFIASGSENSQVYIWNRRNSRPIEILCGHLKTVNCVSWNLKRPQMLASASDDHTIRIWGPSRSKKVQLEKLI